MKYFASKFIRTSIILLFLFVFQKFKAQCDPLSYYEVTSSFVTFFYELGMSNGNNQPDYNHGSPDPNINPQSWSSGITSDPIYLQIGRGTDLSTGSSNSAVISFFSRGVCAQLSAS